MTKPFLTAQWTNLIFFSYAVSDSTLTPYLPPHVELDRWEGRAYVSVVAFDFARTRINGLGIPPLPGLRDFPELNLRFYVRQGDRRGVVFIKEIVPNPLVAGLARTWYNEPYASARLTRLTTPDGAGGRLERHDLVWSGRPQTLSVAVPGVEPETPPEDGFGHWVTQLPWGFGAGRGGRPTRFRIAHPLWRMLPVTAYEITLDFAALYGEKWTFLTGRAPDSVVFAEGSPVTVYVNEQAGPKKK